ncbi:ISAon1 family transposase N-terminal region protein, partial [Bacteroides muris (ex Fokt et al. 2023)]|uniref:ISAon1 family transposase N-terminal region protein n=2 Tax=Bacteroides TaxID=816 RepID=UPI003FA41807
PLRGKPVYLHVRRRRWYDKATGETFSYTYDNLTSEGTKLTSEFVAFLKEED